MSDWTVRVADDDSRPGCALVEIVEPDGTVVRRVWVPRRIIFPDLDGEVTA